MSERLPCLHSRPCPPPLSVPVPVHVLPHLSLFAISPHTALTSFLPFPSLLSSTLSHSLLLLPYPYIGVWKAQFSPVDKALISSSADRTLRLWSMADFSCLRSFEGNTASVLTVHFLSRGMQALSGSADGLVRLWNVGTGECVATFDEHQDKVWALTLPSESHLHILPHTPTPTATITDSGNEEPRVGVFVTAGSDSCIRVWGDRTRELERLRLQEQEDALANAQALDNDVNNRRYGKVSLFHSSSFVLS